MKATRIRTKVKTKTIKGEALQQFDKKTHEFVFLPVLWVDGVLTTIQGEKAIPSKSAAYRIACKHARNLRGQ